MNECELDVGPRRLSELDLEAFETPVTVVDFDYRIAAANRAFLDLAGSKEGVIGRRCFEICHGVPGPCGDRVGRCPLRGLGRGRPSIRGLHEHRVVGGCAWFEVEGQAVIAEDSGRRVGALLTMRPVTEVECTGWPAALAGSSRAASEVRRRLSLVAPTDLPVLVLGETGCCKGVVASTLHGLSSRRDGPLEWISGLDRPARTLYSDIFGCAVPDLDGGSGPHPGGVDLGRGGTLYLAHLESLPEDVSDGLDCLIHQSSYRPLGGRRSQQADVRLVISASTREVAFGSDQVLDRALFPLILPVLRRRPEDLPEIVEKLIDESPDLAGTELVPAAWDLLGSHELPGNLRQLTAVLVRAGLMAEERRIRPEDLLEALHQIGIDTRREGSAREILPLEEMRNRYLRWAVGVFSGSRSELARRLGLSERALYRRIERLARRKEQESPSARGVHASDLWDSGSGASKGDGK